MLRIYTRVHRIYDYQLLIISTTEGDEMISTQPTLVQFEEIRKQQDLIPPSGSNSFFPVGQGRINLFCIRDNIDDYRFDLFTDQEKIYTGAGNFTISGDIHDIESPYRNMTVITNTSLIANQFLTISKGELNVHGTLELLPYSQLNIVNEGNVIFHSNSILIVNDNTNFSAEEGSTVTIYGRIDIHLSRVDDILNVPNVIIDSAAVLNVSGIENNVDRTFSLTDYDMELRQKFINVNTQGEKNFPEGRVGHIWREGSPSEPSQVIGLSTHIGNIPLGDFRLPILGRPEHTYPYMQTVSDLVIRKNSTLHITESFQECKYVRPELYLGIIIGNTVTPAKCIVEGAIIADGINSSIIVDRGATLVIEENGEVCLKDGSSMRCTHNENMQVLFINGTLTIDDISQLKTFEPENIVIGPKGKVVILNPDTGEKRLLFTTPNGIQDSDLYRLFLDRINHVEYHISSNTGIGIDQYFESYSKDMINWFGHRRFEKAIHDGILIWHDGAYIELYHGVTPWVNEDTTLLTVGRLFKSYGWLDKDRLQDVVNRLTYAGCRSIRFRLVTDDDIRELLLTLESIHMKSIINNPISQKYILETDNNGVLFLRNNVRNTSVENLVHLSSRKFEISEMNRVEFTL